MSVVAKAVRGSSYVLVQRAFTFALNALVLRKMQLSVTGVAAVRLELALASVFLLRDGFRLAFLRMPTLDHAPSSTSRALVQQLVNVAWLSTAFSWLVALATAVFALRSTASDTTSSKTEADGLADYPRVLVMYCAAAALEALAEPMFVLAHCSVLVSWQVAAQSAGFVARALVQYACIFALDLGLLAYGYAELAYASALLCVFTVLFYRRIYAQKTTGFALTSMTDLLPHRPVDVASDGNNSNSHTKGRWFHPELRVLLVPLSLQSGVKYLLTEGDKWVLALFASFQHMGVYGIVFHLGSLVPRIVFLPIEDATKTIFSKLATVKSKSNTGSQDGFDLVLVLLKLMHVIGLVFACFGFNYAHTLVQLLYGAEKARLGVADALALYCVYILFLGLNGVCEAVVHAVGTAEQLMRLNTLMAGFFALYAASAALFMSTLQLGTRGIILANCVNMGCRILYCLSFTAAHFAGPQKRAPSVSQVAATAAFWRQALPHRAVLLAFIVSFGVTSVSSRVLLGGTGSAHAESWLRHALHVAVGAVCFGGVALALYVHERHLVKEQLAVLRISSQQPKPHAE